VINIVIGLLLIHIKAKTSSIIILKRISQFNFFENFIELVQVVSQAPIFLCHKKLKN